MSEDVPRPRTRRAGEGHGEGDMPSGPPGIDGAWLRARREAELVRHLADVASAEAAGDLERFQRALDRATLLDPDDPRVVAWWSARDAARRAGREGRGTPPPGEVLAAAGTDRPRGVSSAGRYAAAAMSVLGLVLAASASVLWPSRHPSPPAADAARPVVAAPGARPMDARRPGDVAAPPPNEAPPRGGPPRVAGTPTDRVRSRPTPAGAPADAASAIGSTRPPPEPPPPAGRPGAGRLPLSRAPASASDGPGPSRIPIQYRSRCARDAACGLLAVRVTPPATIRLNGSPIAEADQGVLRLPAGRHQLQLVSETHQFTRVVRMDAGTTRGLVIDLADDGLPVRAP